MATQKLTLLPETALYAEALQLILHAEEKCLESASITYGDTPNGGENYRTGGEEHLITSGLDKLFEDLKDGIKKQIGDSLELYFSDLLEEVHTPYSWEEYLEDRKAKEEVKKELRERC